MGEINENIDSDVSQITETTQGGTSDDERSTISFENAQGYETTPVSFTNNEQFYADVETLSQDFVSTLPEISSLLETDRTVATELIGDVATIETLAAEGDSAAMTSSVASEMFAVKPEGDDAEPGVWDRAVGWAKKNWRGVVAAGALATAGAVQAAGPGDIMIDRGVKEIQIEMGAQTGSAEMEARFKLDAKVLQDELNREREEKMLWIKNETERRNAEDEAELKRFDLEVFSAQEKWKVDPRMNLQMKDMKLAEYVAKRKSIELRQEERFEKWRLDAKKQLSDLDLKEQKRKQEFGNRVARERQQYQAGVAKQRNQADTQMDQDILRGIKGGMNKGGNRNDAAVGAAILIGKSVFGR